MISIRDTTVLALTKLKTRRLRTILTVIISGLLFAALIAALLVGQGVTTSINRFNKRGLNSRYIVQATTDPPLTNGILQNKDIQARATQIYEQTVADKKVAAKKLHITYDSTSDPLPVNTLTAISSQAPLAILNFSSPAALQALHEYLAAHPSPSLDDLKRVSKPYHPTGIYTTTQSNPSGTLKTMENGIEDFGDNQSIDNQQDELLTNGVEEISSQLAQPFMFSGQTKTTSEDTIPAILPFSKAQKLLGLAALPKNSSAEQQLDRIKELYAKAPGLTFSACYRNSVSQQQISTATEQAADIAKNKANKDYQKPTLIYGLPDTSTCSPAPVISDTRTKSEKTNDTNQDTFTQMFGGVTTPEQQKLTFRVVGLTPDQQTSSSTTIGSLLQKIVGSSLDPAVIIPSDAFEKLPTAASVKSILFPAEDNPLGFPTTSYSVEFSNATEARHFIDDVGCTTRSDGRCATVSRPFQLNAYGSDSIALQDLQHKFYRFFSIAAIAVSVLAVIIMAGTIGRMLADGRKETAVFRAIGAKRLDIISVYGLYTLLLSLLITITSLLTGSILAYFVDLHYHPIATAQAQLIFGGIDTSSQFRLFAYTGKIWLVCLITISTGVLGMVFPIVRNVRRNPIQDMRDE